MLQQPQDRDSALIAHVRSVIEAAEVEYRGELISPPAVYYLYAETHFALSALLLSLIDTEAAERWQALAESRLRLWDDHDGPRTFFNAMAVCLALLVLERSGARHAGLREILESIVSRTREHRHVAYDRWLGNNLYLQQVVVDLILLPLANGGTPTEEATAVVAAEFRRYQTSEGFFFDLPREGTRQERLCPPTYVMKMLFLLGVCNEFYPNRDIAQLFETGIEAVRPLLSCDGTFSYFGRTDNSPFAAGLTIFNLRMGGQLLPSRRAEYATAIGQAEEFYRTFPRTASGLLECNRFDNPDSAVERAYSKDNYAKVGQYSVASCAYTLLGCYCFPSSSDIRDDVCKLAATTARSDDLGVARISGPRYEAVLRTGSQLTSWDRRYIGPTILRLSIGDRLLVGAISKTVNSDELLRERPEMSRIRSILTSLREWYVHGFDQLDATTVGFVPVVRHGGSDYLPYDIVSVDQGVSSLTIRYRMIKLSARGVGACFTEFRERLRNRLPGHRRQEKYRPIIRPTVAIELVRSVRVGESKCQIEDVLTGRLRGKEILLSTRSFSSARVHVVGLQERKSLTGWGSDGRQGITVYGGQTSGHEFRYECTIEPRAAGSAEASRS